MSRLRDRLRELIEPKPCVEQQSGSARLAAYARDVRQAHQEIADRRDAEATAAAKPKPETLVESLKFALEASNADNDTPGLNDIRILEAAAGGSLPRSTRESVADILRQVWDSKE